MHPSVRTQDVGGTALFQGKPEGTLCWGLLFSIAPTFFDPSETTGLATPFLFLYALHDALIKPMPQGLLTPCLAESWTESPDGLVHDFKLRQGVTFHNGPDRTRRCGSSREAAGGGLPWLQLCLNIGRQLTYQVPGDRAAPGSERLSSAVPIRPIEEKGEE